MGDRRMGDRRAPEKGVIKIPLKNAILYIIIAAILIVSVSANIVLGKLYLEYKKYYENELEEEYDVSEAIEEDINNEEVSENTCNLLIEGDKEQIKQGETVTYEIKATDINAQDGIIIYETTINYDSDKVELIVNEDENSEWSKTGLVDNYLTMSRKDLVPNSEDQTIAKISFKVKENIEPSTETIEFTQNEFTISDEEFFEVSDIDLNIEIVGNE